MNKITEQQKQDIEMLLERFYDPKQSVDLIVSASKERTSDLDELNIDEAYLLHSHLGYQVSKSRKIQYAIAIAFQYGLGFTTMETPEPTEQNIKSVNSHSYQLYSKGLLSLELDELDKLIQFLKDVGETCLKNREDRQHSADYYQATKATNQLLKTLAIPKEPPPYKKAKKKP